MKKKLLLSALAAACALCNCNAKIIRQKAKTDSVKHQKIGAVEPAASDNVIAEDTNLIAMSVATLYGQAWENYLGSTPTGATLDTVVGFVVQTSEIFSALSHFADSNITAIGFYVGLKPVPNSNQSQLEIVWTPLTPVPPGTPGKFRAMYRMFGGVPFVYDKTMPCPECGITNSPIGPMVITAGQLTTHK